MRNQNLSQPTKFLYEQGQFRASRNPNEVSVSSRLVTDAVADCFARYIPQYSAGTLLDLGCGKAPLYGLYKNYTTDVICVDWINSPHELSFIDIACDLSEPLPLADQQFDTFILSDVLEHIPEPKILWQEMARIIKPNGKLFISVPFYYWLHERPHDYYRYTQYALERFAEPSGFEILVFEQYGSALAIITDITAKNIINLHWRLGPLCADYLQKIAAWYLSKRKKSPKELTAFPLGYFLVLSKNTRNNLGFSTYH
ncbi:methyltransferase domain-containing protein [Methylotuvimicrobium alcaliphilum]|uniref:Methyltransferase type 11 domain-containing protein n=1 Tax=Methylotuvimicrobium alcaliphilum (strain DSM 19304 / NCIMB 14124 / VKM B-2133 / 20Z) TaxID=1091494 RepID=G4SYT9_META2|nr:class I SAM-dependent methyltransferase [Methylotuvimicrobium alcaliphilum]CCE24386.1 conserved protein of unknown function [Methylotuvimicrobium alcaliphilum 20Z]